MERKNEKRKKNIYTALVDIAHILELRQKRFFFQSEIVFSQRDMVFLSKRNAFFPKGYGFSFKTKWFNKKTWNERTKREIYMIFHPFLLEKIDIE